MIDQKKRTVRFETSSLLPLKLVLIEAEKDLPARTPKQQLDLNEELALKLIAQMKKEYKNAHVIARAGGRVGGVHPPYQDSARSNPLFKQEIASLPMVARTDIELEP